MAAPATEGPLAGEVYIWQRHWDEHLDAAIDQAAAEVAGFTILAAEVAWHGDKPQTIKPAADYEKLRSTGRRVGLALRIGPLEGRDSKTVSPFLVDLGRDIVAAARQAGVEPVELQIDFDCAESKLDDYKTWVDALKREIPTVPIVITALPSWLNDNAFAPLAKASDGYILQVHSLERPTHPDEPIVLCDPRKAVQWVEQAGRISVPFRVALPTYGYLVFFDNGGKFVGLAAEGPAKILPQVAAIRQTQADPYAMAGLVRTWRQNRPAAMKGIIWYRLPVETDRLNWSWTTLSTVMKGRDPERRLITEIEYPRPQLADVVLVNAGQIDEPANVTVCMNCDLAGYVAGDGLAGFILLQTESGLELQYACSTDPPAMIRPGDRWKIGWVRFKEKTALAPMIKKADEIERGHNEE